MGLLGNPEDRESTPLAAATSDRDEAIRWARELIAQGLKVVRLRSSASQKAEAEDAGGPSRPTEE